VIHLRAFKERPVLLMGAPQATLMLLWI